MKCTEFEASLALYLYDELPAERGTEVEAHANACATCRGALDKARRLHTLLSQRPASVPSPDLLAQCRLALDEALERERVGWQGLLHRGLAAARLVPISPALAALGLLVFGFSAGWTLRPRLPKVLPASGGGVPPSFAAADLGNSRIRGISRVVPDPQTGEVRITLDAERRLTLEGSLDDPRIQQVLVYAMKNYDNPGIRRDTLDALRAGSDKPNVREALLYALRHDPNAGVRLEALETAQGMEWAPDVRQTLLETLQHDANPGVRVAAINVLVEHSDEEVLPVLEQLAASDRNASIRLKCVRAVRKLKGEDF